MRSAWKASSASSFSPVPMNLIGLPGHGAHRERGAAAGIAVDAGQHDAGDADALGEALGEVDRVLAGECIGHQQGLGRLGGIAHRDYFLHQHLVDVKAAGGIENDNVIAFAPADIERALGDRDRALQRDYRKRSHRDLPCQHRQLFLRRRAVHVERGQQHLAPLALFQ